MGSKYTKNVFAAGARRKRSFGVFRESRERVLGLKMLFFPAVDPNPLVGFAGHFEAGERKGEKEGKRDGREHPNKLRLRPYS